MVLKLSLEERSILLDVVGEAVEECKSFMIKAPPEGNAHSSLTRRMERLIEVQRQLEALVAA